MTACTHRYLDEPTGLACTRQVHSDLGHTYAASSLQDGHDASERRAEEGRG